MHQSEQSLQLVMQVNSHTASISNTKKGAIYKAEYRRKKKAYKFANQPLICLKRGKRELPQIVGVTRRRHRDQSTEQYRQSKGGCLLNEEVKKREKLGRGLAGN